ncbi:MAG: hypothetical protein LBR85_05350 [Oscillospiraceae bacterium]|jgi:hypothetical protein|nr:hypothetical protein [Oscillospiraceae bacterium]
MSTLDEMSRADIAGIDPASLTDIKTVQILPSLPVEQRMSDYLRQIGNPYCFLCGKTPVKVRFTESEKTLDEAVKDHYLNLKNLEPKL